ncbi:hypothetical protein [Flavobacterium soli]|uniref:hypothetical protein n=1 Tax=Flavobacterium soli TaxID=344881 RepID=UPI000403124E|nr:hypothetical protein [Flavobacterium soli]
MRKLFLFSVPFLFLAFTSPADQPTKQVIEKENTAFTDQYMVEAMDCNYSPTHIRVRITKTDDQPLIPSTVYMHVDGVLIGSGGRVWNVPNNGSVVTFSTLSGGNYAIIAMASIPGLCP